MSGIQSSGFDQTHPHLYQPGAGTSFTQATYVAPSGVDQFAPQNPHAPSSEQEHTRNTSNPYKSGGQKILVGLGLGAFSSIVHSFTKHSLGKTGIIGSAVAAIAFLGSGISQIWGLANLAQALFRKDK